MLKITFLNHTGLLDIVDNSVIFYGLSFKNVCLAIKTLKDLVPGEEYYRWCYNYHAGIINDNTKEVYVDNRWLPSEEFAETYIDTKK